jgi:hypothetical protein
MLIAGAAACAPSAPSAGPSPAAEVPPVRALLGEREPLALSAEQVAALDSISRQMDLANRSMSRRLIDFKTGLVPLRLGARKQLPPQTVAQQTAQAVAKVLRPEQRERLCELHRERQGKSALRADKRSVEGRAHSFAGSGTRRREARTWPWCESRPSATAQSES